MILNNEQARLRAAYIDGMLRSIYLQGGTTQRNFAALPTQRDLAALLASHVELAEQNAKLRERSLGRDAMSAYEDVCQLASAQAERIKELETAVEDCLPVIEHALWGGSAPDGLRYVKRTLTKVLAGVAGRDTGRGA